MLKYFLAFVWRLIQRLLDAGSQIMAASILLLVLVVLLLAVAPICLLLMILIQNRMLFRLLFWMAIMSGILLVLVSVFSLEARLFW